LILPLIQPPAHHHRPATHQGTVSSDSGSVVNAAFIGIFSAAQQPGNAPRHLPAHRPGPPGL
jgi:hypothetical protein